MRDDRRIVLSRRELPTVLARLARVCDLTTPGTERNGYARHEDVAALFAKLTGCWGRRIDRQYATIRLTDVDVDVLATARIPLAPVRRMRGPGWVVRYELPKDGSGHGSITLWVKGTKKPRKRRAFVIEGRKRKLVAVSAHAVTAGQTIDTLHRSEAVARKARAARKPKQVDELDSELQAELDQLESLEYEDVEADEPDDELEDDDELDTEDDDEGDINLADLESMTPTELRKLARDNNVRHSGRTPQALLVERLAEALGIEADADDDDSDDEDDDGLTLDDDADDVTESEDVDDGLDDMSVRELRKEALTVIKELDKPELIAFIRANSESVEDEPEPPPPPKRTAKAAPKAKAASGKASARTPLPKGKFGVPDVVKACGLDPKEGRHAVYAILKANPKTFGKYKDPNIGPHGRYVFDKPAAQKLIQLVRKSTK